MGIGTGRDVREAAAGPAGHFVETFRVRTPGRAMVDITGDVQRVLAGRGAEEGLMTLFIQHTSASLTIQENADRSVQADLLDALDRLAPASVDYRHRSEGPDDMPAHIKAVLCGTSVAVLVLDGDLLLGTWQGLYVVEHRAAPHVRTLALHFAGRLRDT